MQLALPLAGTTLSDRYRLEQALGEGATSVVFAARDLRLERQVAVKVLKAQAVLDAGSQRTRFLNEARTLAQLAHPHIVPIFDVGEMSEGTAFFVMELVGERTLASELQARARLPVQEALALLLPLMGALASAHDLGIVHRDLKPANVVLEARAQAALRAKLLDFGIARLSGEGASSGGALGTPVYMAPEQATVGELGPFTDVWAMGVLLFRCLSGRLPFDAPTPTGVLLKIVHERAPLLREACPELPQRVALVIDRALEPDIRARHSNMRAFARALAIACRQDGVALPATPDPIGLPDFATWLNDADVERTGRDRLVEAAAASSKVAAIEHTRPVELSRAKRWPPLAVLGATLAIAMYWLWPRAEAPALVQSAELAKPAASQVLPVSTVERTREVAAPAEAPPQLSAPAAAPASPPAAPSTRGGARAKPRVKNPRPATPGTSPTVVSEWDW